MNISGVFNNSFRLLLEENSTSRVNGLAGKEFSEDSTHAMDFKASSIGCGEGGKVREGSKTSSDSRTTQQRVTQQTGATSLPRIVLRVTV